MRSPLVSATFRSNDVESHLLRANAFHRNQGGNAPPCRRRNPCSVRACDEWAFVRAQILPVYVNFDDPGGLQTGAPVRLAGVRVGTVDELRFMGGTISPTTKRRALVRAKLLIAEKVRATIHQDAAFYVTTQGVLGEQFLAINPGSLEQPVMNYNVPTKGSTPHASTSSSRKPTLLTPR